MLLCFPTASPTVNGHRSSSSPDHKPTNLLREAVLSESQDKYARIKERTASKSRRSLESIERLPKESVGLVSQSDIEDVLIPFSPDAQHNIEIHRTRGTTKVYKAILDQDTSFIAQSDNQTNQDRELANQRQAGVSLAQRVTNDSFLYRNVTNQVTAADNVPVYAEVNKKQKRGHSSSELPDSNYIESGDLFPVYKAIPMSDDTNTNCNSSPSNTTTVSDK